MGAWIEIEDIDLSVKDDVVAPLVGAWIEIDIISPSSTDFLSLLSWERGLKYLLSMMLLMVLCRSSRGSVD